MEERSVPSGEPASVAVPDERREFTLGLILAAGLSLVSGLTIFRFGARGYDLAATVSVLALLLSGYCLWGTRTGTRAVRVFLDGGRARIWLLTAALGTPYLFLSGPDGFRLGGALTLWVFLLLPAGILAGVNRPPEGLTWRDALAMLAIWLPFDLRWLDSLWEEPLGYALNTLIAVNLALLIFLGHRRIPGVGFDFRFNAARLGQALGHFLVIAPIAVPIGLATGFLAWSPELSGPETLFQRAILIFFLTALPEELLFRGLIQNLLARTLRNPRVALVLAAAIFGAAHFNNMPFPRNVLYGGLATIAGLFYGRAYMVTGTLMAGAVTHALVDLTWVELFR